MTTVLVTSAGSSPGLDITRCLRAGEECRIIGADADEWGRRSASRLCDEVVSLPAVVSGNEEYAEAIFAAASEVDFVFYSLDVEIQALVNYGRYPETAHALPPLGVARVVLDKALTVESSPHPDDFPRTYPIPGVASLGESIGTGEEEMWLRPASGTSGRASTVIEGAEEARFWIEYWSNRGLETTWMLQEYLPGRNFNWTGLFLDGERVAWASMERLEYFMAGVAPSGVTGQVKLARTVAESSVSEISERVVRSLDPAPTGLYSVDLREDRHGQPRVTEVNPRPAGRPWLYAGAGVNLPLAAVRALRGESIGDAIDASGYRTGIHLYRQLDMPPMTR